MILETKEVEVDKLVPDQNNPRKTNEEIEEMADSLQTNGQLTPLSVFENMRIENGHRRYYGAKALQKRLGKKMKLRCEIIDNMSEDNKLIQQSAGDAQQKNWKPEERYVAWEKIWKKQGFDESNKDDRVKFRKLLGTTSDKVTEFLEMRKLPVGLREGYDWTGKTGHLTESRSLPDDRRNLIIKYALDRGVGAMIIRNEAKVLKNVSLNVVKSYVNGDISLDQAEGMDELNDDTKDVALKIAKKFKEESNKIADTLKKSDIQVEIVKDKKMDAREFIDKLQNDILDASFQMAKIEGVLANIKSKDIMKHFDPRTKNMLVGSLNELVDKTKPSLVIVEESIKSWA